MSKKEILCLHKVPWNQIPLELRISPEKEKFSRLIEKYWERNESQFINKTLDLRREGGYQNISNEFFDGTAQIRGVGMCDICGEVVVRSTKREFLFGDSLAQHSISIYFKICSFCFLNWLIFPIDTYKAMLRRFKRTCSIEEFEKAIDFEAYENGRYNYSIKKALTPTADWLSVVRQFKYKLEKLEIAQQEEKLEIAQQEEQQFLKKPIQQNRPLQLHKRFYQVMLDISQSKDKELLIGKFKSDVTQYFSDSIPVFEVNNKSIMLSVDDRSRASKLFNDLNYQYSNLKILERRGT